MGGRDETPDVAAVERRSARFAAQRAELGLPDPAPEAVQGRPDR